MATQDDTLATQDEGMTESNNSMSTLEYRGNGIRAVAVIIDIIVLFVIGYLIAILTGSTTATGFSLQGGPAFLWFIVSFAYYIILEGRFGQTVGKKVVGVKVVTESGSPIDYRAALIRNILRIIDGLFFYLIGAIFVYRSEEKQRLGDRVGNTIVVSDR